VEDQGGERRLLEVLGRLVENLIVSARAARSASVKKGASRQAATAQIRSSLSSAFLMSRACMI
jgi:hypothetical protein